MSDDFPNLPTDTVGLDAAEFNDYRERQMRVAGEALEHLWRSIPYGQEITLSDGRIGTIAKFTEPNIRKGDDGYEWWEAGVDIKLPNHAHLEFTIKCTGWGSFVDGAGDDMPTVPEDEA